MGERASGIGDSTQDDPGRIAEDIALTRAEMSGTIDEIQHRLDPDRLSQQAIDTASEVTGQAVHAATEVTGQARDAAKEVVTHTIDEAKAAVYELTGQAREAVRASTVGRVEQMAASTRGTMQVVQEDLWTTIKRNPVPAALTAIGIGWLWTHRAPASSHYGMVTSDYGFDARAGGYRAYEERGTGGSRIEELGSQTKQMADQVIGQVQERASTVQEKAGSLQERAGQMPAMASGMQHQAKGFWQMLEENPVAVGALGVALGGFAGLLIPETEQEHQLMGETRDRVIGDMQGVVSQTAEKVQNVAAEAARTAVDEAGAQGIIPSEGESRPSATV